MAEKTTNSSALSGSSLFYLFDPAAIKNLYSTWPIVRLDHKTRSQERSGWRDIFLWYFSALFE